MDRDSIPKKIFRMINEVFCKFAQLNNFWHWLTFCDDFKTIPAPTQSPYLTLPPAGQSAKNDPWNVIALVIPWKFKKGAVGSNVLVSSIDTHTKQMKRRAMTK